MHTLTPFEVFLLELCRQGIATTYDLKLRASLSIGTTHPALHKLVKLELLERRKQGARGRQEYRLTRLGRVALARASAEFETKKIEDSVWNFETTLRVTAVLISHGRKAAAVKRLRSVIQTASASQTDSPKLDSSDLLPFYISVSKLGTWARRQSEMAVLRQVLKVISSV